ncbi:MAG: Flp pilus assembly protein CpaB [Bacteriovoracia bacterium]
MNNRAFTISFIVAVLAVSMVYSYVSSTEESYKQLYGTERSVVVAKRDIKELDILDETNLSTISLPAKFVQPGTSPNPKEFAGALAIAPIMKDEQVTRSKVTQLGSRTGLARQVAVGKRAVTIRVSDEQAVAKLLKPGDRVDIIAQVDPTGSGNKLLVETRTILQDVLVLATGKYVTNTLPGIMETDPYRAGDKSKVRLSEYTAFPNVTLEVDPFQAQVLIFAEKNLNGVYLSLRNNDDNMKDDLPKIRMQDLMGKDGAAAGATPKR